MSNCLQYKMQQIDDKVLEVVGITGSFHMVVIPCNVLTCTKGTIQVSLSEAIRIAQGFALKMKLKRRLPAQVDGEPWTQVGDHHFMS